MHASDSPPVTYFDRPRTWRVISSRYPPIQLFERIADPADLDAVMALEGLTNPRLRDAVGELALVEAEDRVAGPGAGYLMAPFTHVHPEGSRFSDGQFGVYYCAEALETAVAETRYHRARFLRRTAEPPTRLEMRVLVAALAADLHDLRRPPFAGSSLFDPDDLTAARALGVRLRHRRSWGVAYPSVRHPARGLCFGVFRPRALRDCIQERHLAYFWDGERIARVERLS